MPHGRLTKMGKFKWLDLKICSGSYTHQQFLSVTPVLGLPDQGLYNGDGSYCLFCGENDRAK